MFKTIRKNKKFIESQKPDKIIHIPPKISHASKIKNVLLDGNARSMNYIAKETNNMSLGNVHGNLKSLVNCGYLETTTCEHCDSKSTLYRLKLGVPQNNI